MIDNLPPRTACGGSTVYYIDIVSHERLTDWEWSYRRAVQYAGEHGGAWPTVRQLMQLADVKRDAAWRGLHAARKQALIK